MAAGPWLFLLCLARNSRITSAVTGYWLSRSAAATASPWRRCGPPPHRASRPLGRRRRRLWRLRTVLSKQEICQAAARHQRPTGPSPSAEDVILDRCSGPSLLLSWVVCFQRQGMLVIFASGFGACSCPGDLPPTKWEPNRQCDCRRSASPRAVIPPAVVVDALLRTNSSRCHCDSASASSSSQDSSSAATRS